MNHNEKNAESETVAIQSLIQSWLAVYDSHNTYSDSN